MTIDWLNRFRAISDNHKNMVTCVQAFIVGVYTTGGWATYMPHNWFTLSTLILLIIVTTIALFMIVFNVIEISDGYEGWIPGDDDE